MYTLPLPSIVGEVCTIALEGNFQDGRDRLKGAAYGENAVPFVFPPLLGQKPCSSSPLARVLIEGARIFTAKAIEVQYPKNSQIDGRIVDEFPSESRSSAKPASDS
jgi:hypothetical protein